MYMNKAYCFLFGIVFVCCGQKQAEETEFLSNECRKWPAFATKAGFPAGPNSAFSTSEKKKMGLLLIGISNDTGGRKMYQHPSWTTGGWLAPIQLDNYVNLFTAPAPVVNVLKNAPDSQNVIYKVDGATGEMRLFTSLGEPAKTENQNPYGIMSLCYLCESDLLYVATVAGSTRTKEAGGLYCIDAATGKVKDKLMGFDPFGTGICYIEGKRKIYFGKARTSEIFSVELTASGKFSGKPQLVVSLDGLGPRGDDKAKKIRFTTKGEMIVEGYEFNFNLIAPAEKQTTNYYFRYNANNEKWNAIDGKAIR